MSGPSRSNDYEEWWQIGRGNSGTVFKARNLRTNAVVAIKTIKIRIEYGERAERLAGREAYVLKELKHENIITLLDHFSTEDSVKLVLEYMLSDLARHIRAMERDAPFNQHEAKSLVYQMLRGINFCHSREIVHLDLKPRNLLINFEGRLKIADFGSALKAGSEYQGQLITIWYRPPEILQGCRKYETTADMWSVGCVFAEIYAGKPLFGDDPDDDPDQQLETIFRLFGNPSEGTVGSFSMHPYSQPESRSDNSVMHDIQKAVPRLEKHGIDLLTAILHITPRQRLTAAEALSHGWFEGFEHIPRQILTQQERQITTNSDSSSRGPIRPLGRVITRFTYLSQLLHQNTNENVPIEPAQSAQQPITSDHGSTAHNPAASNLTQPPPTVPDTSVPTGSADRVPQAPANEEAAHVPSQMRPNVDSSDWQRDAPQGNGIKTPESPPQENWQASENWRSRPVSQNISQVNDSEGASSFGNRRTTPVPQDIGNLQVSNGQGASSSSAHRHSGPPSQSISQADASVGEVMRAFENWRFRSSPSQDTSQVPGAEVAGSSGNRQSRAAPQDTSQISSGESTGALTRQESHPATTTQPGDAYRPPGYWGRWRQR